MLALTRKKGEALIIDGKIEVKILEVNGDKVRIGIEAPKDVAIFREEVYDMVKKNNQEAKTTDKDMLKKLQAAMKDYEK